MAVSALFGAFGGRLTRTQGVRGVLDFDDPLLTMMRTQHLPRAVVALFLQIQTHGLTPFRANSKDQQRSTPRLRGAFLRGTRLWIGER